MSEILLAPRTLRAYWVLQIWRLIGRELRDYLRDWRILFPIFTLTLLFPL